MGVRRCGHTGQRRHRRTNGHPADASAPETSTGPGDAAATAGGGCGAGALLCEDFESYTTGAPPNGRWSVIGTNGTINVDTTKPRGGSKSLHVLGKGTGAGGTKIDIVTKDSKVFPVPGNALFGRMMVFLAGPWPASHVRIMHIGGANAASGNEGTGYALASQSGNAFEYEGMNDHNGKQAPLTTGKWICFEWQISAPMGGAVSAKWWFDGNEVTGVNTGGWKNLTLEMFELGYDIFNNINAEFWIDDVALGTTRQSCPEAGAGTP